MKKILVILLAMCLAFTAAGCSCNINIRTGEKDSAKESSPDENDLEEDEEENGEGGDDGSGGLIGYTEGLPTAATGQTWSPIPGQTIPVEIPTISFPYEIPDTGLVIRQVSSYSGYFIEDGSDKDVKDIAAIVLTNNGGDLDFVGIGIAQGERNLAFSGSQIPAGATVIIQEQSGAAYSNDPYYSATANTKPAKFEMSEKYVKVQDNGDGTFSVINISEEILPEVILYFKNYLPDEDVYVGGITYNITLEEIEPETAVEVTAVHYDRDYTVFVEVVVVR